MNRLLLLVLVACSCFVSNGWAATERIKPKAYEVSFSADFLPPEAKVFAVFIEVEGSQEILIRSLPAGWVSVNNALSPTKVRVVLRWFPWKEERGSMSDLTVLSGRVWIRPNIGEDEQRIKPQVSGTVTFVLPNQDGTTSEPQELPIPKNALKLTYTN